MPAVDRNVLRIGVFELLYVDDVPDAVAVDEAVSLVRDLSTDDSPAFVNGVLGDHAAQQGPDRRLRPVPPPGASLGVDPARPPVDRFAGWEK